MKLKTPYYIIYEDKLRKNLELIKHVSEEADVKIIMALKANAVWKTFPIIAEYVTSSTASSLNEMYLSHEYLGTDIHAYCPVYTDDTFPAFLNNCSHITFNSIAQYNRFAPLIEMYNSYQPHTRVSPGLRVNPRCSVIETDLYNPCVPGSRFGENPESLINGLPQGIEGLHFHALCESSSYDLEKVLAAFKEQYSHLFGSIKWINMGGGHLMTRADYDVDHLIDLLNKFHAEYPHISLIMEPGSAFTWQTGELVTTVLDIVENDGIKTAIIDASFACHMPDTLEMPYRPNILEAIPDDAEGYEYRLGGNSCLSGDFCGPWKFKKPLSPGDKLTLLDMNHYTTVKTTMFNGIQHPSIYLKEKDSESPKLLRKYLYRDYKSRMD